MPEDKRCGTCRHWAFNEQSGDIHNHCASENAPLHGYFTLADMGTACPCWAAKEKDNGY